MSTEISAEVELEGDFQPVLEDKGSVSGSTQGTPIGAQTDPSGNEFIWH